MPTAKKQKKKRTKEEIAEASRISSLKCYRLKNNIDPNKPVQKKVSRKGETEEQRKARLAKDRQEKRAKQREEEERKMNNAPGTPGFAGYIPGQANQDSMPRGKANFSGIKFAPNQSFGATNLNHGNGFGATNFNTTQHNAQGGQNSFGGGQSSFFPGATATPDTSNPSNHGATGPSPFGGYPGSGQSTFFNNSNQFSGQTGGFQTPHGQSTVAHAGSDVLIATAGSNPLVFDFLAKQMESEKAKENAEKILKLMKEQQEEENKRTKEADETREKSEKEAAEKREKSQKEAAEKRERFYNKKIDTVRAFNADEADKLHDLVQTAKKVVQKTPGLGPILATSLFSPTKAIDSKPAATGPKKRCRFDDSAPASGTRRTPLGPHPAANSPSGRPTPSQLFSTPSWSNPAGSARGGDGNTTVPMEEDQENQAGAKRFTGAPPVFNNGNLKPSNTRGRP